MSHPEERKEKKCLNCNAVVHGRYCSMFGQENLEPQETIGHLVSHVFNDITHFDGKFFSSLKWLIRKPGFLSEEYIEGRRASYLNPVRMYVFTSFFFFLIYFSFFSGTNGHPGSNSDNKPADSAKLNNYKKDSLVSVQKDDPSAINGLNKALTGNKYRDRKQYDSLIDAGIVTDHFMLRTWRHKQFAMREKYGTGDGMITDKIGENIRHYVPQMFFLSLPLFALFLKILYVRRKKYYYVAHLIFTLHLYIFVYIAVLVLLFMQAAMYLAYLHWLRVPVVLLCLYIFFYTYRAMRNFYAQQRAKTIFKFILLLGWLVFIIILLMALLLLFSVFKL